MLSTKEVGILSNIIKHCIKINEKIGGLTKEEFTSDEDVVEIVCFNILQIGELAKNLNSNFIMKFNKVPWKQIKAMRDKVAHGYGTIDIEKVWNTCLKDINTLCEYCKEIQKQS